MRPFFTIHAGEFLVGEHIEKISRVERMDPIKRYRY